MNRVSFVGGFCQKFQHGVAAIEERFVRISLFESVIESIQEYTVSEELLGAESASSLSST